MDATTILWQKKCCAIIWILSSCVLPLVVMAVHGSQPMLISKSEANTFLSRIKRADRCTTEEVYCEENKDLCYREYDREHWCLVFGTQCSVGMYCYLSVPCFVHWETNCTDIDECASNPCQNGAMCINGNNKYTCSCPDGFTGVNCEENIDDCASNPCLLGATCVDSVSSYTCVCVPGYTGTRCAQDINECASDPCQNGGTCLNQVNTFTCLCIPGYTGVTCDVEHNECESDPCQNGATCNDGFNTYTCTCVTGFSGGNCEENIDECASNPCTFGLCEDLVDSYVCQCGEDFTGSLCETDMCLPGAADIVFVLDASLSQNSTTFNKQRQYVKHFVSQFPIGDPHTQFSVVTFSFDATIHFYFNTFKTNSSILDAIDNISTENGPSRVAPAISSMTDRIFQSFYGARARADKYMIIVSDGMFSDFHDIEYARMTLHGTIPDVNVLSVMTGDQVLHHGLITIAGDTLKVHSIATDDALNLVLQSSVHAGCQDCYSRTTDLLILMDSSFDVSLSKFYKQIDVIKVLLKKTPISSNGVHVAYTRFAADVRDEFDLNDFSSRNAAISAIVTPLRLVQFSGPSNVSHALEHTRSSIFGGNTSRPGVRKMVVLLTPGQVAELDRVKQVAQSLKDENVIIAAVGIGEDSGYMSLLEIASDTSLAFLIGDETYNGPSTILTLINSMDHVVCEMD